MYFKISTFFSGFFFFSFFILIKSLGDFPAKLLTSFIPVRKLQSVCFPWFSLALQGLGCIVDWCLWHSSWYRIQWFVSRLSVSDEMIKWETGWPGCLGAGNRGGLFVESVWLALQNQTGSSSNPSSASYPQVPQICWALVTVYFTVKWGRVWLLANDWSCPG